MKRVVVYIDESRIDHDENPIKLAWDSLSQLGLTCNTNIYPDPWRYVYEEINPTAVPIIKESYGRSLGYRVEVQELDRKTQ